MFAVYYWKIQASYSADEIRNESVAYFDCRRTAEEFTHILGDRFDYDLRARKCWPS